MFLEDLPSPPFTRHPKTFVGYSVASRRHSRHFVSRVCVPSSGSYHPSQPTGNELKILIYKMKYDIKLKYEIVF